MLCADLGHKQVRVEAILLQADDVEANAANFEYHDSGHFYTDGAAQGRQTIY